MCCMDGAIPQTECDARQCNLCKRPLDRTGDARAHAECGDEFHSRMNEKRCIYCGMDAPGSMRCADCERLDSPPFLGYPGAL